MAKLEVKNLTISFRTNNGAVRAVRVGTGEVIAGRPEDDTVHRRIAHV